MIISPASVAQLKKKVQFLYSEYEPDEELPTADELKDFLTFQKFWFKLRTGVDFRISQPISRRSHHLELADLAPRIFKQELNRVMIRIAPRYGKSEFAHAVLAYSQAYFTLSNWIYVSIDTQLIREAAEKIEQLMKLPQWKKIYGVSVVKRKSNQTSVTIVNSGQGEIYFVSAYGGIAGHGACIQNYDAFSGGIIIDDFHKISRVHSQLERDNAGKIYVESLYNRLNDKRRGLIMSIGQALQEDDLNERLKQGKHDIYPFHVLELPSLDDHDHALYPELESKEQLIEERKKSPYMFSAQKQQRPMPAGGSIFKEDCLVLLDSSIFKKILFTWITIDTAETDKNYNDPTVMKFSGLYKIENNGVETGGYGIHILDCMEDHIDAGDLEERFDDFYSACCLFPVKPTLIGIEKKSAGVTMLSVLKKRRGLNVVDTIPYRIERDTGNTNIITDNQIIEKSSRQLSKTNRFLACQYYWNSRLISATEGMNYTQKVKEHMGKITANNSHMHDDIADTIADDIFMVYITGYIPQLIKTKREAELPPPNLTVNKNSWGNPTWRQR